MYLIRIITFNKFLLTNLTEFTTAFFSLFVLVLVRACFRFRFRRCTEPNPEDRRSEGIRIANDAN
jgi:hypothetical protein